MGQGCPRWTAGRLCREHWEHPLHPIKYLHLPFHSSLLLELFPGSALASPSFPSQWMQQRPAQPGLGLPSSGMGTGSSPRWDPACPWCPRGPWDTFPCCLPALPLFPDVCRVAAIFPSASPTPGQNIVGGTWRRGSGPQRVFLDTCIMNISFFPGFPHPASVLHPPAGSCPPVPPSSTPGAGTGCC